MQQIKLLSNTLILPLLIFSLNIPNPSKIFNLKFGNFLFIEEQYLLGIPNCLLYIIETSFFKNEQVKEFIDLLKSIKSSPKDNIAQIEHIIYERKILYVFYQYMEMNNKDAIQQNYYNQTKQIALKQLYKLQQKIFYNYIGYEDFLSVKNKENIKNYRLSNFKAITQSEKNKCVTKKQEMNKVVPQIKNEEWNYNPFFIDKTVVYCSEEPAVEESSYEQPIEPIEIHQT